MSDGRQGRRAWQRAVLLVLITTCCAAYAATVTPEDEYRKLIKVNEDVQPLGENPFGEKISLYDGSLSFRQADVSLSGNGPVLELSRILRIEGERGAGAQLAQHTFGDWLMELPRLETFTPAVTTTRVTFIVMLLQWCQLELGDGNVPTH